MTTRKTYPPNPPAYVRQGEEAEAMPNSRHQISKAVPLKKCGSRNLRHVCCWSSRADEASNAKEDKPAIA
ncbi:hypothetical protein Tco_1361139 [Tanacetum coccineum]